MQKKWNTEYNFWIIYGNSWFISNRQFTLLMVVHKMEAKHLVWHELPTSAYYFTWCHPSFKFSSQLVLLSSSLSHLCFFQIKGGGGGERMLGKENTTGIWKEYNKSCLFLFHRIGTFKGGSSEERTVCLFVCVCERETSPERKPNPHNSKHQF